MFSNNAMDILHIAFGLIILFALQDSCVIHQTLETEIVFFLHRDSRRLLSDKDVRTLLAFNVSFRLLSCLYFQSLIWIVLI